MIICDENINVKNC